MTLQEARLSPAESPEWVEDCMKWRGQVLTGKFWHWCFDWDFLPVDETTSEEFDCCHCFDNDPERPPRG
jgi:hypothetical protein